MLRTPGVEPVAASSMYVLAFQIGITVGSWSGGAVIDGVGSGWLAVCGLGVVIVAAVVALPLRQSMRAGATEPLSPAP